MKFRSVKAHFYKRRFGRRSCNLCQGFRTCFRIWSSRPLLESEGGLSLVCNFSGGFRSRLAINLLVRMRFRIHLPVCCIDKFRRAEGPPFYFRASAMLSREYQTGTMLEFSGILSTLEDRARAPVKTAAGRDRSGYQEKSLYSVRISYVIVRSSKY